MLSYETLDLIADAYNPALAIAFLGLIGIALVKSQWKLAGFRFLNIVIVSSIAYGLMFLDHQFNLWPAMGLDYSTHTAVALVLVACLAVHAPKGIILWIGSFIGYVLLMLYQEYHTLADIVVTGLAVGVPTGLVLMYLTRAARMPSL